MDNLSNGGVGGLPTSNPTRFNSKLNKGPAGFDIRHVLVGSAVWMIPGRTGNRFMDAIVADWMLGNIFTFHSGLPYSAFLGTDNENIGSVGGTISRVSESGGRSERNRQPHPNMWFNTAAFAVPPLYTVGTPGRNILRTRYPGERRYVAVEGMEIRRAPLLRTAR